MLRCIAVGVVLCACSFDPSGFTSPGGGDADAGASAADAAAPAMDADPTAPDADPSTPDAAPPPIDAAPPPPVDAMPPPPIDAMPPPPDAAPVLRTLVFRNGLGGYTGTRDTSLRESESSLPHGSDETIRWDMVSGASPEGRDYGLLRFEGIAGSGAGQVPTDATVVSATLSVVVVNPGSTPSGALHEVAADWGEFTSWDSFGFFPGVQADEIGAFVDDLPTGTGASTIDVTSAVAKWITDPFGITHRGLIFVPDNENGVEVRSSESDVAAERPTLTVEFFD